jgi:hypothetical protein
MPIQRSFTPIPESEIKDLGFGAVVARESRQRLLNRDGSFNVSRDGLPAGASLSLYHALLTMSWSRFLFTVLAYYVAVNAAFGLIYAAPRAGRARLQRSGARHRLRARVLLQRRDLLHGRLREHQPARPRRERARPRRDPHRPHEHHAGDRDALRADRAADGADPLQPPGRDRALPRHHRARVPHRERAKNQILELQATVILSRIEDGVRRFHGLALERKSVAFFPLSWTSSTRSTKGVPCTARRRRTCAPPTRSS